MLGCDYINVGKQFENDFIKSVEKVSYCWYKRLNDNASSWAGGKNTRFASTNECDFLLFDCKTKTLSALELKSTKNSLTYWREDFDNEKHKQYNIKKNQILGLQKWSRYYMNCGFIFNFYENDNVTYFVMIDEFIKYTSTLNKKSIGLKDIFEMNPIEINNDKLRTHYRYDISNFLDDIHL